MKPVVEIESGTARLKIVWLCMQALKKDKAKLFREEITDTKTPEEVLQIAAKYCTIDEKT